MGGRTRCKKRVEKHAHNHQHTHQHVHEHRADGTHSRVSTETHAHSTDGKTYVSESRTESDDPGLPEECLSASVVTQWAGHAGNTFD